MLEGSSEKQVSLHSKNVPYNYLSQGVANDLMDTALALRSGDLQFESWRSQVNFCISKLCFVCHTHLVCFISIASAWK